MRKILFRSTILIIVIISCFFITGAEVPEKSKVKAYILMEPETGTIIEEFNSHEKVNVGYLVKLMSILLIAEDIDNGKYSLNDMFTVSENVNGTKGAVIWLEQGDKISVEELLKAVIIGNANDALMVLIENSSENTDRFIMDMNAKAFDLGIRNTFFSTPYGYSTENAFASAHDIALICSELIKYDFLMPLFSSWREFIRDGKVELVNENSLARSYSDHVGFKACHSDESLYCVAEGARKDDGRSFISIVLGAEDSDTAFNVSKKMIKKAFSEYRIISTMFPEEMLMPVKVRGGRTNAVEITIRQEANVVVPKSLSELRSKVVLPNYLTAPLRSEQPIGTIAFYNDKKLVFETEIITKTEVKVLDFIYVFERLLSKLIEK